MSSLSKESVSVLKIWIVLATASRIEASPQFETKCGRFFEAPIIAADERLEGVLTAIRISEQGLTMLQWILTPRGPTKEVR
jgi:hypothetical protein